MAMSVVKPGNAPTTMPANRPAPIMRIVSILNAECEALDQLIKHRSSCQADMGWYCPSFAEQP